MSDDTDFSQSKEAEFRRNIRSLVRKGPFTKSERDTVLAFLNFWFAHRNNNDGVIYPGRYRIAKSAGGVSIKTVSRCLKMLRDEGVIAAHCNLNGFEGKATEYSVSIARLCILCSKKRHQRKDKTGQMSRVRPNGGTNVSGPGRDKMSHHLGEASVINFPNQNGGRYV